ncbi:MAG: hypothetical protein KDA99_19340, partial [Planctomycetales bacterium]|nr:hypothetical protein [Planctomycetales bacterium]
LQASREKNARHPDWLYLYRNRGASAIMFRRGKKKISSELLTWDIPVVILATCCLIATKRVRGFTAPGIKVPVRVEQSSRAKLHSPIRRLF